MTFVFHGEAAVADMRPYAKRLGRALRARRGELGLSQEHVAIAAGMDRRHYQELEQGFSNSRKGTAANPRLATVFALAKALKLDPGDLVREAWGLRQGAEQAQGR